MSKRFLNYEHNIETGKHHPSFVDETGTIKDPITLSDFENDLFYEYEEKVDITGYEHEVYMYNHSVDEFNNTVYSIDIPLELGQTWECVMKSNNSSDLVYSICVMKNASGELYMGSSDPTFSDGPFIHITNKKFTTKGTHLSMIQCLGIYLKCVEGSITETKVKQIDKKYVPNMLTVEVDSTVITDVTIANKVKEAILNGQSICIYHDGAYIYPTSSMIEVSTDSNTGKESHALTLFGFNITGTASSPSTCRYMFGPISE